MVGKDGFFINPKHQYHLSHQRECVYDAQSLKERRLLCESMLIPIERWTSILKMVIREKKGDYYVNLGLSKKKDELQF